MTIEEATAFAALSIDMFAKQSAFKLSGEGRLDKKVFTEIIRDVIKQKLGDPDGKLRSAGEQPCKMQVSVILITCSNTVVTSRNADKSM